jgi:hypothetical protein
LQVVNGGAHHVFHRGCQYQWHVVVHCHARQSACCAYDLFFGLAACAGDAPSITAVPSAEVATAAVATEPAKNARRVGDVMLNPGFRYRRFNSICSTIKDK